MNRVQLAKDRVSAVWWTRRNLLLALDGSFDVDPSVRAPSANVSDAIVEALRLNADDLKAAMEERDAASMEASGRPCTGHGYKSFDELMAWRP